MNKQYHPNLLELKNKSKRSIINLTIHDKILKELIIRETSFLNYDASVSERMLYIKYGLHGQPKCPTCNKLSRIDTRSKTFRIAFCSVKCSLNYKDPKTGINEREKRSKLIKKARNKIDPETGLTNAQMSGLKTKVSNSKIDPKTGLSGYNKIGHKIKITKNKIDPETGLTNAQMSGLKTKVSNSKIDPKTGLTGYQKSAKKAAKTMKKLNLKTGKSIYDKNLEKISKRKREFNFPKIKHTFIKNFNEYQLISSKHDYINSGMLRYKHNCGKIRTKIGQEAIRCLECYPYNKSMAENEILEFCKSLSNNVISNTRSIISPLEIDIFMPDCSLGIEYNGLFYHSSDALITENQDKHINKTNLCKNQGIQLFHIFENEWIDPIKQDIWKSIIINKLGKSRRIFARKCEVRKINDNQKQKFLELNHLQGNCVSSFNIGLYYRDELVSLMTFGKPRFNKNFNFELLRFCNKINISVIGGASKLFKNFLKKYSSPIISYGDIRKSSGNLYKHLGFELARISKPNYWYWKPGSLILEHRIGYQKHKLEKQLEIFDYNLTESENMYNNGFRKIYDCGNQVWVYS